MPKTINIKLSQDSIQAAIKELDKYKQNLISKNELFVKRLGELGIPIINQNISAALGDADKSHNTYIRLNSFESYSQAVLVCEGSDLLFIEFGAGIHYNGSASSSPHPKGNQFGYTIGSYGKGLGKNDYWYYKSESGESVRSYGTQATMPMYKASQEIRLKIRQIAKEVFRR